jgi:hypothetical protein
MTWMQNAPHYNRTREDTTIASGEMVALAADPVSLVAGREYIVKLTWCAKNSIPEEGLRFDILGGTAKLDHIANSFTAFPTEATIGFDPDSRELPVKIAYEDFGIYAGEFVVACTASGTMIPRAGALTHRRGIVVVKMHSCFRVEDDGCAPAPAEEECDDCAYWERRRNMTPEDHAEEEARREARIEEIVRQMDADAAKPKPEPFADGFSPVVHLKGYGWDPYLEAEARRRIMARSSAATLEEVPMPPRPELTFFTPIAPATATVTDYSLRVAKSQAEEIFSIKPDGRIILRGKEIGRDQELADILAKQGGSR